MRTRGQRNLAAASATLMGLVLWALYLAFWELPFIAYTPPRELKPFLVTYPVLASLGLLYWAIARGELQRPLLRFLLGGMNALVTVYLGMEAYERLSAGGLTLETALAVVLIICCALTTWALWSGPGHWQSTWLLAVAGVQMLAAPVLFLLIQLQTELAAGDVVAVLFLAALPFGFVLLGQVVARGATVWCAALALVYTLAAAYHVWAAVAVMRNLGGENAPGYSGLVGLLAVALAAGFLAYVNVQVLRRGGGSEEG